MKKWMQKLADQLQWGPNSEPNATAEVQVSEDRASLLFLLDAFNKNIFEIDSQSPRKVRETLDMFCRELLNQDPIKNEKTLFRLRQFFSSYRIDEYTYVTKTFEEFRSIIWDFVDQLGEEIQDDKEQDAEIKKHLVELKDAVESNSIQALKTQSRQFIDSYVERQMRRDQRRTRRLDLVKKNLDTVKRQLVDANYNLKTDHLTGAHNRKSYEEQAKNLKSLFDLCQKPTSLILLDIDFFKKINDTYGHPVGDVILQECVRHLREVFARETDIVARIGGEEFAVLLPEFQIQHALVKAEKALQKIRQETYVKGDLRIQFTVSMGVAQLHPGESTEDWLKRADQALYKSKTTGRNKVTSAETTSQNENVA